MGLKKLKLLSNSKVLKISPTIVIYGVGSHQKGE